MSKLEKLGLFFMLLGVSSFRDGGWSGGIGAFLLMSGWAMFIFPREFT